MRPSRPPLPKGRLWPATLALAALLAVLAGCRGNDGGKASKPGSAGPLDQSAPNRLLLYPDDEGALTACEVFLPASSNLQDSLSTLANRYLEGPPDERHSNPFPEDTRLRALYLIPPSTVLLDLTEAARRGGGTAMEIARVYGLIDTLAINHPSVDSVQILIEGQEVETLLGQLDLSRPLPPNPKYLGPNELKRWRADRGL